MSKKRGIGSFIGGALVGLGIGLLFAPKSGSETRKDLSNKLSNLWDKVRGLDANEIKESLEAKLSEIEECIKELDKEKVLAFAKEKCEVLKNKGEELIELAKKAGKPIIEDAASSVRNGLINVTKEALKRLEDK